MDVSWYIVVHTSSTQGDSTRAPLWAWPSSKRLSTLKIPWFAVSNKAFEIQETCGGEPSNELGTAIFYVSVVPVPVHLSDEPMGDFWPTPVTNKVIIIIHLLSSLKSVWTFYSCSFKKYYEDFVNNIKDIWKPSKHFTQLGKYTKMKKTKFSSFKTKENEIKTHKIAAMVFWFVFLCLFWRFKACECDVFKITVELA